MDFETAKTKAFLKARESGQAQLVYCTSKGTWAYVTLVKANYELTRPGLQLRIFADGAIERYEITDKLVHAKDLKP